MEPMFVRELVDPATGAVRLPPTVKIVNPKGQSQLVGLSPAIRVLVGPLEVRLDRAVSNPLTSQYGPRYKLAILLRPDDAGEGARSLETLVRAVGDWDQRVLETRINPVPVAPSIVSPADDWCPVPHIDLFSNSPITVTRPGGAPPTEEELATTPSFRAVLVLQWDGVSLGTAAPKFRPLVAHLSTAPAAPMPAAPDYSALALARATQMLMQ